MGFQTYWRSLDADQKRKYARRAKTSVGYLQLVAGGHRMAGPDLGKRLVQASGGQLGLHDIRPDWAKLANGSQHVN